MAKFAPQVQSPDQQFAMYGYVAVDMFVRGIEAAGECPGRESFITALRAVSDYVAGGLIPPTDLYATFGQAQTCYAFVRVNETGTAFDVVEENLCGQPSA